MKPILRLTLLSALATRLQAASPSVTIDAGTIHGGVCDKNPNAAYYKSIPFAEPPVGSLRFAAPTAYSKTFPDQSLDGTQSAASCIQFNALFAESNTASEDCLYIDVWAPLNATKASGLPVRVWLYGGGNSAGGISDPMYDGCNVPDTGAILVSINYRLGPLGFFYLKEAGYGGNQGIQDALLGLQWVQDNIAAFGGNPKNVLFYGESAGAIDSFTIATLEQAPQLFSSAIFESGGGLAISTSAAVENISSTFAQNLKCGLTDKSCLQAKSVDEIQSAFNQLSSSMSAPTPGTPAFAPCVDGDIIPKQPTEQGVRVPSVFGTNLQEGTLFIFAIYESDPAAATNATYETFIEQSFDPSFASRIKAQYPLSAFSSTAFPPIYAMSEIITASSFFCPARRGLATAAAKGISVWTYRFSHSPSCSWSPKIPSFGVSLLGATHSSEIPFVFGTVSGLPEPNGSCVMTDAEKNISSFMTHAWTRMAAEQKPADDSVWPAWTDATKSLGINIVNSSVPGFINYTECDLWDEIDQKTMANATNNATATATGPSSTQTSSKSSASANVSDQTALWVLLLVMFTYLHVC